ncbi:MAG TPA: hypothetical protein VNS11_08470 [Sphingomicrobium sp.]|nr:hypothetical protein [Sphingomicrobium sp.]HWJ58389.1 hypothetical protein [Sphingomicrobium sp.]
MLKAILIATAALAVAAPAASQTTPQVQSPPPATPVPAATPKGDPNRIICEREQEIGSRLGGAKVCKTAAQWEEERRANRDALDALQRQNTSVGAPSG